MQATSCAWRSPGEPARRLAAAARRSVALTRRQASKGAPGYEKWAPGTAVALAGPDEAVPKVAEGARELGTAPHRTLTVTPALRPGRRTASVAARRTFTGTRWTTFTKFSAALSDGRQREASLRPSRDGVHLAFEHAWREGVDRHRDRLSGSHLTDLRLLEVRDDVHLRRNEQCDGRPYGGEHPGVQRQVGEQPVRGSDDAGGVQLRLRQGDRGFGRRHTGALKLGVCARGVQLRLDRRALRQTSLRLGHPRVRGVLLLLRRRGARRAPARRSRGRDRPRPVPRRASTAERRWPQERLVAGEIELRAPLVPLREIDRGACARDVGVRATYGIRRAGHERLSGGDAALGARGDHLLLRFGLGGLRLCLRELGLGLLQSRRVVGVIDLGDQLALLDPVVVLAPEPRRRGQAPARKA